MIAYAPGAVRCAAIMQPTYLPWLGYFDLIDQSDMFIFLDSVQFAKRSWQQRNRIKGPNGAQWLTVPVQSKHFRDQKIAEVEIDPAAAFQEIHLRTIRHLYGRAPFFSAYFPALERIFREPQYRLADLNIELIGWCCGELAIKTEMVRSSMLGVSGKLTELLVNICEAVGVDRYLSAAGSRDYIEQNNLFAERSIELVYHVYTHPTYRQIHGAFEPYLSVLDLLMNEGPASLEIIRSGRGGRAASKDSHAAH